MLGNANTKMEEQLENLLLSRLFGHFETVHTYEDIICIKHKRYTAAW